MRVKENWNRGWKFFQPEKEPVTVDLPHTWNAVDGTDGGNDYFRGSCRYIKTFSKECLPEGERYFLEINGANASADVYLNNTCLLHHDGGYSTFRVDLTKALEAENTLEIQVDNSVNDRVYPQVADFTFYGGLYRDVNLLAVPASHFALTHYGAPGIRVRSEVVGEDARVTVQGNLVHVRPGQELHLVIEDQEGKRVAEARGEAEPGEFTVTIPKVHRWDGRKDPYLYRGTLTLSEGEQILDQVETPFGVRTFRIDPEQGFFLNERPYPLRGVSRHQDRKGLGNALLPEHHREDAELIAECGANTIRLAHYQHDQFFYDLCDQFGFVVWAEIPYISKHMKGGRENTLSQMRELILQNENHPSIVVWGLSNEITMGGEKDPDLLENHRLLKDLVKKLDPTRNTAMAVVSMCDIHADIVQIPDVVSYNHYFGWYGGDTSMNGPWLDHFHETFPHIPIGLSEYGCEGLDWHTSEPAQGDYTEEYQAYYHEELIKQLFTRPYLWATHVWNMFDFGADARSEGGEPGQNHKGLVTFDRAYKKDAFYAYKAWLSEEPFVHLCGKRYVERVEAETKVTVYSNQPEVELFVNGVSVGVQTAADHFFRFTVKNQGESQLKAVAGTCVDRAVMRKVDTFPEQYRLQETGTVLNWFEIETPPGYFSLQDRMEDILQVPEGKTFLEAVFQQGNMGQSQGDVAQTDTKALLGMMGSFTVLRMASMLGVIGKPATKEELLEWNRRLNKIPKP